MTKTQEKPKAAKMDKETYKAQGELSGAAKALLEKMGGGKALSGVLYPSVQFFGNEDGNPIQPGRYLACRYEGSRVVKTTIRGKEAESTLHKGALIETNAPLGKWDREKRERVPYDGKPGEIVEFFGAGQLDKVLAGVENGSRVLIEYQGKDGEFHRFAVVGIGQQ
jgi:hypothetical protein